MINPIPIYQIFRMLLLLTVKFILNFIALLIHHSRFKSIRTLYHSKERNETTKNDNTLT